MNRTRPWWWLRKGSEIETIVGTRPEAGERKKLVVTKRDWDGSVLEETWTDEVAFDGYDESRWKDAP